MSFQPREPHAVPPWGRQRRQPFVAPERVALLANSTQQPARHYRLLPYRDRDFMQLLDGEESVVRQLFGRIARDPRHRGVIVLVEENVAEPLFADWSMGFRNLDDEALSVMPGFTPFVRSALASEFANDPSGCAAMLDFFQARP
jgi:hypothetical protein